MRGTREEKEEERRYDEAVRGERRGGEG